MSISNSLSKPILSPNTKDNIISVVQTPISATVDKLKEENTEVNIKNKSNAEKTVDTYIEKIDSATKEINETQEQVNDTAAYISTYTSIKNNKELGLVPSFVKDKAPVLGKLETFATGKANEVLNFIEGSRVAHYLGQTKVASMANSRTVGLGVEFVKTYGWLAKDTTELFLKGATVGAGALQATKGVVQISNGKTYDGSWNVVKGSAFAATAVVSAPASLAIIGTVETVHFGDKATKEYGFFKNNKGKNESALEHVGTVTKNTYKEVAKKDGEFAAGIASTFSASSQALVSLNTDIETAQIKAVDKIAQFEKNTSTKLKSSSEEFKKDANEHLKKGGFINKAKAFGEINLSRLSAFSGKILEKSSSYSLKENEKHKKKVANDVNISENLIKTASNSIGSFLGKIF